MTASEQVMCGCCCNSDDCEARSGHGEAKGDYCESVAELMVMIVMDGGRKERRKEKQEASGRGNAFYYCACYF